MFCGVNFGRVLNMVEGVVTRGACALCVFAMLMRVADNWLGAEGGAAVGRSLTALTALQSLNLGSNNAACFVMLFRGLF